MVNIISTPSGDTMLVVKREKIQIIVKIGKTGRCFVVVVECHCITTGNT
jgi:hypothetical protein